MIIMGMYDMIICEYPLPQLDNPDLDASSIKDYQTKDLDCALATYTIQKSGALMMTDSGSWSGDTAKVNTIYKGYDGDLLHGTVNFYHSLYTPTDDPKIETSHWIEYKAYFIDSILTDIKALPVRSYDLSVGFMNGFKTYKRLIDKD